MSPARSYRAIFLSGLLIIGMCTVGIVPTGAAPPNSVTNTDGVAPINYHSTLFQISGNNLGSSENNSTGTVRYVDPENISTVPPRATSLERAGVQIAESLGVRLEVSANELVNQDYDDARSELGEAYQSDVVRLNKIAEATEDASDDQLVQALETAGENQREIIDNGEQFQTLYTEYQQARASQNETRARDIAQQLAETTVELNQTSTNLSATYAELEGFNQTQANRAQQQIQQALTQAEQLTQNAQQSTYTETRINIESISEESAPEQPFTISGRLEDISGATLENRTVELVTPRGNIRTKTDVDGSFTITHAPVQLSAGEPRLTVQYIPKESAGYLRTETTVSPQVLSTPSTLSVTSTPDTLSNSLTSKVTGKVLVDNQTISGIPVTVRIDDTIITTTSTNESGQFYAPISAPITTSAGDHALIIMASDNGQAVETTIERRSITVEPVETKITMSASRTNTTTVNVSGQLTRIDEEPIASQLLPIAIGDKTVGYVQTDTTGQFAGSFTLTDDHPAIDGTEQTTTVSAQFNNETTHLDSTRVSKTVTFFPKKGVFGYEIPAIVWMLGVVAGVLVFAGAIIIWRYRDGSKSQDRDPNRLTMTDSNSIVNEDSTNREPPTSLFERAEKQIDSTPEQALQLGYLAARRTVAKELGTDDSPSKSSATHWEFYQEIKSTDVVDEEMMDLFESITIAYERSVYSAESTPSETVEETLNSIRSQLEIRSQSNHTKN